jgi:hypothetical protein
VLEHGCCRQKQNASLEYERDFEVLQQNEHDDHVQWNAEKVHDGGASLNWILIKFNLIIMLNNYWSIKCKLPSSGT